VKKDRFDAGLSRNSAASAPPMGMRWRRASSRSDLTLALCRA